MSRRCSILMALLLLGVTRQIDSLPKRPFWKFLSGGAFQNGQSDPEIKPFSVRPTGSMDSVEFIPTIRRSGALDSMPYAPLPLDEKETSDFYIPENAIDRQKQKVQDRRQRMINERNRARENEKDHGNNRWTVFDLQNVIPKVNFRCDPLVNFKLKQKLVVMGTCVTLGLDYLSDIAQWRSYCAVEDAFVQGRFSLRGSELGWAKSWLLNLGMGEEHTAKFKLRMGLNLRTARAYAKLRFRTEPISPFDIGEGLSCAGKLPMPVSFLPVLRNIPLRVEYRLRLNAGRPVGESDDDADGIASTGPSTGTSSRQRHNRDKKVFLSSGLGTLDVSLDELNFCLEWDEKSPVWGLGVVRSAPLRKGLSSKTERGKDRTRTSAATSGAASSGGMRIVGVNMGGGISNNGVINNSGVVSVSNEKSVHDLVKYR